MRSRSEVLSDLLGRFVADDKGATTTEYALIAFGIAIAIIASVNAIGAAIGTALK